MTMEDAIGMKDRIHIIPVDDLREHYTNSAWCWCEPSYENEGKLVVHHSKDGREFYEQVPAGPMMEGLKRVEEEVMKEWERLKDAGKTNI